MRLREEYKRIEGIGLVSEHAIPFIFSSFNAERDPIIVIDDIVIRGNVMAEVTEDIYAFTKQKPYVSTIYISELCDRNKIQHHQSSDDLSRLQTISECEIHGIVEKLCDCIKSSSLPMELEFPIFHLNERYDELRSSMKQ